MAKHFAVTVQATDGGVDVASLARRLGELVGRSEVEVEAALRENQVIVQRELSYGEALEFQRELGRRRIPSQVRADVNLEGMELWRVEQKGGAEPVVAEEIFEEFEVDDFGEEVIEFEVEEVIREGGMGSGAWGELFPDLEPEIIEESALEELDEVEVGLSDFDLDAAQVPVSSDDILEGVEEESGRRGEVERFDGRQIQDAFSSVDDERPPYQPRGFDTGPVHIPLLAALLTAVAPGSGQVYNGQEEEGRRLGWRFILIRPWIEGVRQAWVYGEAVHTYYAPRPAAGAVKRAFVFALKWWVSVAILVWVTMWSVSSVQEYRGRQAEQQRLVEAQQTIYFLQDVVADAQEVAEGAASEAAQAQGEEEIGSEGTMSREERARRLFIVGYHYCVAREYAMCAATMGRVTALSRDNRDAFRLQTWASVQARGGGEEMPMPEVGEVPTLEDFELELSLRGEDVDELLEAQWAEVGGEAEGAVIRVE